MYVKVCGITNSEDAHAAIRAGADILGLNLIPESKRFISSDVARQLVLEVGQAATCVAIVANVALEELLELREKTGVSRLQLHGNEPDEWLQELTPWAYRAARVATQEDIRHAARSNGHPLLVDAKVEGALGGTGHCIDWPLLSGLATQRPLILAGGLTPDNVARAVKIVQPFAVDVASGVERTGEPRRKDLDKMRRFVSEARGACTQERHSSSSFLEPING